MRVPRQIFGSDYREQSCFQRLVYAGLESASRFFGVEIERIWKQDVVLNFDVLVEGHETEILPRKKIPSQPVGAGFMIANVNERAGHL